MDFSPSASPDNLGTSSLTQVCKAAALAPVADTLDMALQGGNGVDVSASRGIDVQHTEAMKVRRVAIDPLKELTQT